MTDKPRHGKPHSKKGKAIQRAATTPVQRQAEPVSAPTGAASVRVEKRRATPSPAPKVRYPYISAELKRIGILGGGIITVLVVLALVLS